MKAFPDLGFNVCIFKFDDSKCYLQLCNNIYFRSEEEVTISGEETQNHIYMLGKFKFGQ